MIVTKVFTFYRGPLPRRLANRSITSSNSSARVSPDIRYPVTSLAVAAWRTVDGCVATAEASRPVEVIAVAGSAKRLGWLANKSITEAVALGTSRGETATMRDNTSGERLKVIVAGAALSAAGADGATLAVVDAGVTSLVAGALMGRLAAGAGVATAASGAVGSTISAVPVPC